MKLEKINNLKLDNHGKLFSLKYDRTLPPFILRFIINMKQYYLSSLNRYKLENISFLCCNLFVITINNVYLEGGKKCVYFSEFLVRPFSYNVSSDLFYTVCSMSDLISRGKILEKKKELYLCY